MDCREFDIAAVSHPAGIAGMNHCFFALRKTTAKTTTKTV